MKKEWQEIINHYTDEYGTTDWERISSCEELSEDFIRDFKDKVNWWTVSEHQFLSEDLIREFKDKVNWVKTSIYQKLSEDFIREFKDKVDWGYISMYQKLSEDFIIEFKDKINLSQVSKYQRLSEDLIREFKDKVNWYCISKYQILSEDLIREFKDDLKKFPLEDSWNYKSTEFKKQQIIDSGNYECYYDYFIAYKSIRYDRYSHYNFQYQYLKGNTYECFADASKNENSFGLSVWTKKEAENYAESGVVVRCKVYYKDVARLVHGEDKIRCFKIEILD